ncbi:putative kinase domain protein [Rhizoctonia solani 123E]|uniref:Putative kinase domain protein n=1 Tax=Rhizoctonia solani 123E TaxID=1423351 RepID=A0A074RE08_9AGAM|nr:putative kinase domain protein [Rhizoctonia solani 123E]
MDEFVDSDNVESITTLTPTTRIKMDRFIECELENMIFRDPKFVERFLLGDATKLGRVREKCRGYYDSNGQWKLESKVPLEKVPYKPLLDILNAIKAAVDAIALPTPADPLSSNNDPSIGYIPVQPMFIDTSTSTIRSDWVETELIKPNLVLLDDVDETQRHWEHVRFPIEIKKLPGLQKAAMKQLSRYARAVFSHQLHRRHLYAMMVCGTEATFVRFDRAGILYSPPLDMRKDSKAFTDAFASLLMLDRTDQGYDPAFTCRLNNGRLDYYVDLPASAFANQESTRESTASEESQTHQFKVVDRLCHRRSICGRATIVLRIRSEEGGDDEYILKIMWRDPEHGQEGEVLQKVKGRFGLATRRCKCARGVVETVQLEELEVCDKLTDIAIEVPREDEHGGKEAQLEVVDTTVCYPASRRRPRRICVFIVMSSKGAPLERAESPRQFIQAVLDAILGYWGLFNLGILHRDISEGNVLMLLPGQHFSRDNNQAGTEITDKVLIQSEAELNKVLDELGGREPTGMLSDYDLFANHSVTPRGTIAAEDSNSILTIPSQADVSVASLSVPTSRASGLKRRSEESSTEDTKASKKLKTSHSGLPVTRQPDAAPSTARSHGVLDFRTGTPAFMSIHVTRVSVGQKYHHSFLDDIESFFWLILWSAAAHLDDGVRRPTTVAQSTLNSFNQHDQKAMAQYKLGELGDCSNVDGISMQTNLGELGNSWASHRLFSEVIVNFGALVYGYHYAIVRKKIPSPVDVFPEVVRVFLNALSDDSD